MDSKLGALKDWLDESFFREGAFLTSSKNSEIILGKGGSSTLTNDFSTEATFYLKDFYRDQYLSYTPKSVIKVSREELKATLLTLDPGPQKFSPIANDDDLYEKDFKNLLTHFNSDLRKVVLISRETYESFEGKATILHLLKRAFAFGAGFPYGIWNPEKGMIGSTPEILYRLDHKTLSTFALAGTSEKGQEEELLASKKDRIEHNLVVQDIKEKLEKFVSDLAVYDTEIHPYKNLIHLKTDMVGKIREGVSLKSLTSKLSPTAALGGYPKEASLRFLEGTQYFQKYSQRYFGSALGYVDKNLTEFIVAIRNVQWEKSHLFIESGGGLVSESQFEKELNEIHLKRNAIGKNFL